MYKTITYGSKEGYLSIDQRVFVILNNAFIHGST